MFPPGHVGIGLLAFAPVAYVLVVRDREANLLAALTAVLVLSVAPDLDRFVPGLAHRGLSHTFLAAGCLGVLTAVVWRSSGPDSFGSRVERTAIGFIVGALAVCSHLLGDVVTPMGIRPFAPLDSTEYGLSLVSARHVGANLALLACGVAVIAASVHLAHRTPDATTVDSPGSPDAGSEVRGRTRTDGSAD